MLTFVKLGGSVITDKTGQQAPNLVTIRRMAGELRDALAAAPAGLILGHGSGHSATPTPRATASTAGSHRRRLARLRTLRRRRAAPQPDRRRRTASGGRTGLTLQPSTTLRSARGELIAWDTAAVGHALAHRLVPVVHGDVALDEAQGAAIISTEQLLLYLARNTPNLRPTRIILVGEAGVYTADPRVNPQAQRIPSINRDNIAAVRGAAGGSHGADVTGGMRGKSNCSGACQIAAGPDGAADRHDARPAHTRAARPGRRRRHNHRHISDPLRGGILPFAADCYHFAIKKQ